MSEVKIKIFGMHCVSCVDILEKKLEKVPGVHKASIDFTQEIAIVVLEKDVEERELTEAIQSVGYQATILDSRTFTVPKEHPALLHQADFLNFLLSFLLTLPLFFHMFGKIFQIDWFISPYLQLAFASIVQFYCAASFYKGAYYALKALTPTMDLLIVLGTLSAYLFSFEQIFEQPIGHLYFETSAMIITLVLLGRWIEGGAREKAIQTVKSLFKLLPKKVQKLQEEQVVEVAPDGLKEGDIFFVKPGENVATDGIIVEGVSSLDESFLTGEMRPKEKKEGDKVFAGTHNHQGLLKVKASVSSKETNLQNIIRLVEKMHLSKAPIQRLADQVAEFFVPLVLLVAVFTFLLWWLYLGELAQGVMAAVSTLIVACPCALGIATPMVMLVASGIGARCGLIFQEAKSLEWAAKMEILVFDKTGTLTKGVPKVVRVHPFHGQTVESVLTIAASFESFSSHPLAKAVLQKAKEANVIVEPVSNVINYPGLGIEGEKRGKRYFVGSLKRAQEQSITIPSVVLAQEEDPNSTQMVLIHGDKILGAMTVEDPLRENAKEVVEALKAKGIEVWLLSGDKDEVARQVAKQVGIEHVIGEVLPETKADVILGLKKGQKILGCCGDGINDAPALACADVGFSIGSGSDVAIAASDITLIHSDLNGVLTAINLSEKTIRKVKQNLFFAFIYNALAIPFAASSLLNPMLAALLMVLSSLSVTLNAYFFNRYRPYP